MTSTEKKDVNCHCTTKSTDDFYILCDYCSEWYHGICHSIQLQDSRGIHQWACSTCSSFGKETLLLDVCGSCTNYAVYKSKYCSESCGDRVNFKSLKRIISQVKQMEYKTCANQKYLIDVYKYDELQDEMEKLNMEKKKVEQ